MMGVQNIGGLRDGVDAEYTGYLQRGGFFGSQGSGGRWCLRLYATTDKEKAVSLPEPLVATRSHRMIAALTS